MADPKLCKQTYRLVSYKLAVRNKVGKPQKVIVRPHSGRGSEMTFGDSDDEPTLIKFDVWDEVDIQYLLNNGSIAVHNPPRGKSAKADG